MFYCHKTLVVRLWWTSIPSEITTSCHALFPPQLRSLYLKYSPYVTAVDIHDPENCKTHNTANISKHLTFIVTQTHIIILKIMFHGGIYTATDDQGPVLLRRPDTVAILSANSSAAFEESCTFIVQIPATASCRSGKTESCARFCI